MNHRTTSAPPAEHREYEPAGLSALFYPSDQGDSDEDPVDAFPAPDPADHRHR